MTSDQYKQIRKSLNLTQSEMAKKLGMTQPSIARIESGARQPTKQQAAAIFLLVDLFTRTAGNRSVR